MNTYWRHPKRGRFAGMHLISRKGRAYRETVARIVQMQRGAQALAGLLRVEVDLEMPDRRLRDVDNLTKALFDALSHAGVWGDDGQVDDYRVRRVRTENGDIDVHKIRDSQRRVVESGRVTVRIDRIQSDS